jgi:hypothetical protein
MNVGDYTYTQRISLEVRREETNLDAYKVDWSTLLKRDERFKETVCKGELKYPTHVTFGHYLGRKLASALPQIDWFLETLVAEHVFHGYGK